MLHVLTNFKVLLQQLGSYCLCRMTDILIDKRQD